MRSHDAIVIGGGPAGSTAALALARRGWSVALLEKAPFPRRKVCGEYISAGGWAVLRALDAAEPLEALAGPPVRRVGLFALDAVLDAAMPAPRAADPWGRAVGREILDSALLDEARGTGADVLQPCTAHSLRVEASHAVVHARGAGGDCELRAPVVIAAHGSWEHGDIPTQAARSEGRPGDLLGFKARFTGARLAAGLMPLVLFPGGYGGLVESDGARVSFSCCIRRDALARCRAHHRGLGAGEAVLAHATASARGLREALEGAWREGAWLAAGPIRPGIRVGRMDGLLAVGNAAGEAHPLIAEGIGMAIQSAWLLAETLAAHPPAAFDRDLVAAVHRDYARRWRSQFAARVRASSVFAVATGHAMRASSALICAAPVLLAWGAHWSGKAASPAAPHKP